MKYPGNGTYHMPGTLYLYYLTETVQQPYEVGTMSIPFY